MAKTIIHRFSHSRYNERHRRWFVLAVTTRLKVNSSVISKSDRQEGMIYLASINEVTT